MDVDIITYIFAIYFVLIESAIVTKPDAIVGCTGENITIGWVYDNPSDLGTAAWSFNDGTGNVVILSQILPSAPVTSSGSPVNVEFVTNGTIKLYDISTSYTGNYYIALNYNTNPFDSHSVTAVIYDNAAPLSWQNNSGTSGINFTCSGSPSIPKVIRVTKGINITTYDRVYLSIDSHEGIECCYEGQAANCNTSAYDSVHTGELFCIIVRNESSPIHSTTFSSSRSTTNILQNTDETSSSKKVVLIAVLLSCSVVIVCVVGMIVYYYKGNEKRAKTNNTDSSSGGDKEYHTNHAFEGSKL